MVTAARSYSMLMKVSKELFHWCICALALILAVSVWSEDEYTDTAAHIPDNDCFPEIRITDPFQTWSVCLNYMLPPEDSCAEIKIDLGGARRVAFSFLLKRDRLWRYGGMKYASADTTDGHFSIDVLDDSTRGVLGAVISIDAASDSLLFLTNLSKNNDLPELEAALPPANFTVLRRVYTCAPPEINLIVENRLYTYPPGYGRREPVLNYPELSMFHYGRSVRMPTSTSLRDWAEQICLYHILHPKPFTFDDPDEIMRSEAWRNKVREKQTVARERKKSASKLPLVSLRPLHYY